MVGRFEGQVAMVFGAARPPGMGRETARLLAGEGASVACLEDTSNDALDDNRTTPEALTEVVGSLRAQGADAMAIELDFTDADAVDTAVAAVVDEWGRVDVAACLILETGPVLTEGALLDVEPEMWRQCIERNLTSIWLANRAVARPMIRQGSGAIVNLSSEGTRAVPVGHGAYIAAKAGVEMMSRILAREVGRHGVRVNVVSPLAVFESEPSEGVARLAQSTGRSVAEWLAANVPLGRHQQPAELAASVVSLLSSDLSFISGETLYATGGAL